jgi:hypothetical protein
MSASLVTRCKHLTATLNLTIWMDRDSWTSA